jgi:hypothetical protein
MISIQGEGRGFYNILVLPIPQMVGGETAGGFHWNPKSLGVAAPCAAALTPCSTQVSVPDRPKPRSARPGRPIPRSGAHFAPANAGQRVDSFSSIQLRDVNAQQFPSIIAHVFAVRVPVDKLRVSDNPPKFSQDSRSPPHEAGVLHLRMARIYKRGKPPSASRQAGPAGALGRRAA